jgi:hypothetical protein
MDGCILMILGDGFSGTAGIISVEESLLKIVVKLSAGRRWLDILHRYAMAVGQVI